MIGVIDFLEIGTCACRCIAVKRMDSRGHVLLSFTFSKSAVSVVIFPLHSSKNGCTLCLCCVSPTHTVSLYHVGQNVMYFQWSNLTFISFLIAGKS